MKYRILNGRVQTRALEFHIVDHCNLRCDQCCSYSPFLKGWHVSLEDFERDLARVGKFIQPEFLKIVGGEPLLHPQIDSILEIANQLQVTDRVSVTTNGHLLRKVSDRFWTQIQMLTVSIYPSPELDRSLIRWVRDQAKAHKISVSWKTQDKFVQLNRKDLADVQTAQKTYKECWIHHRCHSIKGGRFYSCTRPQYIQKWAPNPELFLKDGIDLSAHSDEELPSLLQTFLEQDGPLFSCRLCQGGQAHLKTQRQMSPAEVKEERENLRQLCLQI